MVLCVVGALWSLVVLSEAGVAFPDPRGRNSVPTGPLPAGWVAEDLLSSVSDSWQADWEGRAVLAEVGKASLPVCWRMRSPLPLAEALLRASLWNAVPMGVWEGGAQL